MRLSMSFPVVRGFPGGGGAAATGGSARVWIALLPLSGTGRPVKVQAAGASAALEQGQGRERWVPILLGVNSSSRCCLGQLGHDRRLCETGRARCLGGLCVLTPVASVPWMGHCGGGQGAMDGSLPRGCFLLIAAPWPAALVIVAGAVPRGSLRCGASTGWLQMRTLPLAACGLPLLAGEPAACSPQCRARATHAAGALG